MPEPSPFPAEPSAVESLNTRSSPRYSTRSGATKNLCDLTVSPASKSIALDATIAFAPALAGIHTFPFTLFTLAVPANPLASIFVMTTGPIAVIVTEPTGASAVMIDKPVAVSLALSRSDNSIDSPAVDTSSRLTAMSSGRTPVCDVMVNRSATRSTSASSMAARTRPPAVSVISPWECTPALAPAWFDTGTSAANA